MLVSFSEIARNADKEMVVIYCSQVLKAKIIIMVISWKRDIPLSEILLNSLSSVSSRLSLRSARAPLMVLYIKYGSASVPGISTVLVGK